MGTQSTRYPTEVRERAVLQTREAANSHQELSCEPSNSIIT
jgi:hypothetical protein